MSDPTSTTTPSPDDAPSHAEMEIGADQALISALQAGAPHAPRQLVEQYQTVIFALCRRMLTDHHEAEDVVQETFLRALRAISGVHAGRPLRPWLLGIAANRCRTALARRGRRPAPHPLSEDVPERRPAPADDLADELEWAMKRLRPEHRLVFVLYHEQELPYDEIAAALGRPVGTIKTWLHRARAQLAGQLASRGAASVLPLKPPRVRQAASLPEELA